MPRRSRSFLATFSIGASIDTYTISRLLFLIIAEGAHLGPYSKFRLVWRGKVEALTGFEGFGGVKVEGFSRTYDLIKVIVEARKLEHH